MTAFNRHYRAALQPLLDRVATLPLGERYSWLEELRTDCPSVTRDLEALLGDLQIDACPPSHGAAGRPRPVWDSPEALGLRG